MNHDDDQKPKKNRTKVLDGKTNHIGSANHADFVHAFCVQKILGTSTKTGVA